MNERGATGGRPSTSLPRFLVGMLYGLITMMVGALCQGAEPVKAPRPIHLRTSAWSLDFEVGPEGRLYQSAVLGAGGKVAREDEAYPQAGDGYVWEPALQVIHSDGNTSTALIYAGISRAIESNDCESVQIKLRDAAYALEVALCFRLHSQLDVIEQWIAITNQEAGPVVLEKAASTSVRVGKEVWLTHFFGDWAKEMLRPITEKLTPGIKSLDSKLGVRATQYQSPSFILSQGGPPVETRGKVLIGSLAWSGNFQCEFEENQRGVRAICGINPFASNYQLRSGQGFATPHMIWVGSTNGVGGASRKLHAWARRYGVRAGDKLRSVLLNNWEATGFDFDAQRIGGLFEPARQIGAELFLLDDGWFGNQFPRTNDLAGLGDWEPNHQRLPQGLAALASAANHRDLRFGIWLEPEMVNPRSVLFERHPDWTIQQPKRPMDLWRNQMVLDLTRPEVQAFEWQTIHDVLAVPGVGFAKWDCNRHATQPGSGALSSGRQTQLWIDYVQALYALMARTATTFPATELMLCAGGGGRADYGALPYFHEFWPSDNTDPLDRVAIQWNYSYFFPATAMAGHVTQAGHRPLHFASCVAMSECLGLDLDLNQLTSADRELLAGAVMGYKQIRDLVQMGDLYRLEDPNTGDRGALTYVAGDCSRAVLFVYQLRQQSRQPVLLAGLDPDRFYRVTELNPPPGREGLVDAGKTISGAVLMQAGMVPTCVNAMQASVILLTAVVDGKPRTPGQP